MPVEWPTCRHRGERIDAERFHCGHPRLVALAGVTHDSCVRCAAGGVYCDATVVEPAMPTRRTQPCDDLGPIIDARNQHGHACRCPGKWLRRCEIHGQCTLSDTDRPNVPCCLICGDYSASG